MRNVIVNTDDEMVERLGLRQLRKNRRDHGGGELLASQAVPSANHPRRLLEGLGFSERRYHVQI